jgi:Concanavalin A-like lectin/glucanases superfamily
MKQHIVKIIISAIIAFTITPFTSFAADALHHWNFDEGSGDLIKDSGKIQNNGSLQNSKKTPDKPLWVEGKFGKALEFNGFNYVQLDKAFANFDKITVMAWIKTKKVRVRGTIIGDKGDIAKDGFRFEYTPWWGRLAFQYGDGSKTQGIITKPNAIKPGFWTHVAVSYDGKVIKLYHNGNKILEKVTSGKILGHSKAPRIGVYLNSPVYGFIGVIDDIKIYSTALSGKDIMDILVEDNKKSTHKK